MISDRRDGLAQLITFLSIYCSPIYLVLSKPHILTVMDPPDYQLLRPVTSFRDSRLLRLFVLSFLFQIFNPIVLPNPVLTRLPYLFFFRYSTNSLFLIFTFAERDSPMLYLLVKRSIYTTFSIVFVSIAVAYLGRAPAPFFTEKYVNQFYAKDLHFWKLTGYKSLFWWAFQPWPFSFFDPTRHNRGHRFVRNSRLYRGKSFVKRRVSTYFFQKCLTDGKERLSFASLPSLAIFEKQICGSLPTRAHSRLGTRLHLLSQTWVLEKLVRTKRVEKELTDRVLLLDNDYSFSKAMEKRTRLKSRKRSRIPQVYDPFVNNFRMRIPIPHTYLTLAELNMKRHGPIKERKLIRRIKNKEYLKDWISKNNRRRKKQYRYKRMFQFMYEKGTLYDFKLRKILEKTQKDSSVIWEEMIELNPLSQALFFTYLERENSYYLNTISTLKAFFISNYKTFSNTARQFRLIENSSMRLARNLRAETAFRYRKLRNIGFTSIRRNRYKWVKRYARVSDFRRKLFKGSLRARRRKTLLWNALQGKIHSSFFLRVWEIPLFYLSSNSSVTFKPSVPVVELIKTKNFELYQQLLENSPALKERLINEESTRTRSALATRTDIGPIHNGRGYLLVFQSKFRKYIKLPTFILFKTIIRFLLRQESEWSKDWTYWRKEIHINCTFDGEEYSRYDLPPRWLREGIQIKVVSPFRLKPWYTDENKKKLSLDQTSMKVESSESQTLINKRKLKRKKPKFIYLTVLGYQTDKPFGPILKETSFWKPVQKKLIRTYQKRRLPRQVRQTYQFINSRLHLEKVVKFIIGGEIYSTSFYSKPAFNQNFENKKTVESPKVDFVNSVKQEMKQEVKTDNLRKTSINQVAIDTALNNTDFSNSFENLKEFIFSPRLFLAASADEFLVVLKNLLFKIGRSSIYLFYDFVTLHKQLRRLREEINHENNVVPKNGVQLLSQVRLNSTLTEIQNKKENGINHFPIHSDTKIDNQEIPNEILSENTAKYIEEWGFWNNNWLDCFPKYNLSSIIWREIAPSRWKENLEDFTNLKKITTQNNPRYRVYPGKFHSYSIYTQKQDVIRQKSYFKDRFEKISNKRKNISKNLFSFPNSSTRKYNLKFDLMLWLDPKMLKMKGLFTSKNKTRKTKRLLEDKPPYYIFRYGSESDKTRELFKYLFDRGIEDREESDYLFNRKWKLEMQMESFRKLSDITRLLRTEQELMALCENSELDPDLLGFQLRNKNKNRWFRFLGFFYFHRFGNLLDDQSLLYKIVNPLLNVKSIAKKRDKKRLLFHIVNEHNCKQVCNYNIEDLLLTRRQREFRFLNCLVISKQLAQRGEGYLSHIINEIEKTKNDVEEIKNEVKPKPWCLLQDSSIESQRIKRFLWPSHRLEELACTGRFCFGATTESRFAALKIRMYPII
ncbi:hypothetical protein KP509_18G052800 [Ceratopteris richardii]|uniref:Protein TIC 214 n=1 Tax=Ceratopteris richardii TaxID=49495 RepID=A0A8T2SSX0_CERRI|nr:hypothetical protein KP509_18G052800 [Ceratopteris richardii]